MAAQELRERPLTNFTHQKILPLSLKGTGSINEALIV
jgi:hypothetical protein